MTITGNTWHCFAVFGKRCVMPDTFQVSTNDQCEKKTRKILEEIFQEYTRLNNKKKEEK